VEIYPSFGMTKQLKTWNPFKYGIIYSSQQQTILNSLHQVCRVKKQKGTWNKQIIIEPRDEECGERSRNLSLTMFSKTNIKQPSVPKE
jgi:hypothetical protein